MSESLHYTPSELARILVDQVTLKHPRAIVDFCVGDGRLLSAAKVKWPNALYYANDIDTDACNLVRHSLTGVHVSNFDFFSKSYQRQLKDQSFDLILLNPPFSATGKKKWNPVGRFSDISCSLSMAFVLSAIPYLKTQGELLAIMPTSASRSELDASARAVLEKFDYTILSRPSYGLFPGIDASVFNLRIVKAMKCERIEVPPSQIKKSTIEQYIVRGNISLPKAQRRVVLDEAGWIHTTSLYKGEIRERYSLLDLSIDGKKYAAPNSVLLPRVGRIRPDQIVVTSNSTEQLISDCIFAVSCKCQLTAIELKEKILANFNELRSCFVGTGAPYITVSDLWRFLVTKCDYLCSKPETS